MSIHCPGNALRVKARDACSREAVRLGAFAAALVTVAAALLCVSSASAAITNWQPPTVAPPASKPSVPSADYRLDLGAPYPAHCGLVGELIGSMTLLDEGMAAGLPPDQTGRVTLAQPQTGFNLQGVLASGDSPLGARRQSSDLRTYRAIAPWVTVYEEVGNAARAVRVQLGPASVMTYSRRARAYQALAEPAGLSGALCAPGVPEGQCRETTVQRSVTATQLVQMPAFHRFFGWFDAVTIDPHDLEMLVVSVPVRLVGPDASRGRYLMRVGAQYRERAGPIPVSAPHSYAGVSRLRRLSDQWIVVSLATVVGGGVQDPGSGQPVAFMVGHPPPCAIDAGAFQ